MNQSNAAKNYDLIRDVYTDFNARRVDRILAMMSPQVDWPNMIDNCRARGHNEVRDYWLNQFASIDPQVEPKQIVTEPDGRVSVDVHQVVRSLDGALLADQMVQHVYTIQGGLIERMDVRDIPAEQAPRISSIE